MYQEQSLESVLRSLRDTYAREIRTILEEIRVLEISRLDRAPQIRKPSGQPEPGRE